MSSRIYCFAQFEAQPGKEAELFRLLQSLEPNTLREDGCLQYRVTRRIASPHATGSGATIVFNEIWQDMASFEAHCRRKEITGFFATHLAEGGLVASADVSIYSDEPEAYDAPAFS